VTLQCPLTGQEQLTGYRSYAHFTSLFILQK